MKTHTNRRGALAALASAVLVAPRLLHAQNNRPLEWVIGYPAGGGSDLVARSVAEPMGQTLGRPIVIANKPGAATNLAADYVARSKDLGNVMLTADFATLAANPFLFKNLSYNAETAFAPVGMLARFPMLLVVGPQVSAANWNEFRAWAAQQPGGAPFASAGAGSPHHLAAELLRERSGLDMRHVAYRGAAPAVQDLIGGQVPFAMMDTAAVQQHLATGRLRALGVASAARLNTFPDIPTLAEQGLPGVEAYAWQGLAVPAGTAAADVQKLNQALVSALNATAVKARFQTLGVEPLPGTPQQMASYTARERERWGKLIRDRGITLD